MQVPFWAIDYACHPDCLDELHGRLLYWADRRARFALDTPSGRPAWFVNVFSDQVDRIRDLEAAGFASQADVGDDSWSKVLMRCTLQTPAAVYPLPAGFTVRPLGGQAEVEAYVTLHRTVFESRNMTVGWRARTLRQPSYIPDLDLVAVAPDGAFVGFCVGWLHRHEEEASGQIEPMGVHPDLRQQGLGQAIVSDALRRLRLHGAGQACVETDTHRNGALALYESVGFRAEREVLVYRRDYAPG
jgi:mycothiol synthase